MLRSYQKILNLLRQLPLRAKLVNSKSFDNRFSLSWCGGQETEKQGFDYSVNQEMQP
jgi:hypothetical protein